MIIRINVFIDESLNDNDRRMTFNILTKKVKLSTKFFLHSFHTCTLTNYLFTWTQLIAIVSDRKQLTSCKRLTRSIFTPVVSRERFSNSIFKSHTLSSDNLLPPSVPMIEDGKILWIFYLIISLKISFFNIFRRVFAIQRNNGV